MELLENGNSINHDTHEVMDVSIEKDFNKDKIREIVQAMKSVNQGIENSFYWCTEGYAFLVGDIYTWHFAYPKEIYKEIDKKMDEALEPFGFGGSSFGIQDGAGIACPCR